MRLGVVFVFMRRKVIIFRVMRLCMVRCTMMKIGMMGIIFEFLGMEPSPVNDTLIQTAIRPIARVWEV